MVRGKEAAEARTTAIDNEHKIVWSGTSVYCTVVSQRLFLFFSGRKKREI